jgi:glyoxylate/hydroxypyruvate reductase
MASNTILVAVNDPVAALWVDLFRAHGGGRPVRALDDIGDPADIAYACTFRTPSGLLATLPNLKLIVNLGAGVDRLFEDPRLPSVPIVRAAHADLSMRMTEYVVLHTLRYHRRQPVYEAQQRGRVWKGHSQPPASEVNVGVMGLGVIGTEAAQVLARVGFNVAGWSRSPKSIAGIATFHGEEGLDAFLARTEILVCLLPLTPATNGILNRALFARLKSDGPAGGAYLINAGRGGLQIDGDILAALDDGTLAGATLDVFAQEPLPPENPMWTHAKVTITPHNAGDISPMVMVGEVVAQFDRFERGEPLLNVVDRDRGY